MDPSSSFGSLKEKCCNQILIKTKSMESASPTQSSIFTLSIFAYLLQKRALGKSVVVLTHLPKDEDIGLHVSLWVILWHLFLTKTDWQKSLKQNQYQVQ